MFPAPIRAVLGATSHQEACELRAAIDGKRMSAQAFHILGKVTEVDRFIRASSFARERVFEVHPELAFACIDAGRAIPAPKRSTEGFTRRYRLLTGHVEPATLDTALAAHRRRHVARDDVLDAFAVMLAAGRIAAGAGRRVPVEPERDSYGLDMAIWY